MRRFLCVCLLLAGACSPRVSELSDTGGDDDDVVPPGRHHPTSFVLATEHGPDAKFMAEDCRSCHGAQLQGIGTAVSCDSCHVAGWKANCTYCHGGGANQTGAPPRDLDGATAPADLSFRAHTSHVTQSAMHAAFDCNQCHVKPVDALTDFHWFDFTPGKAEVNFATGINPNGAWNGSSCTASYCHGNGQGDNGTMTLNGAGSVTCTTCHANQSSSVALWTGMSGEHRRHLQVPSLCNECHASVVTGGANGVNGTIANVALHVNGTVENSFPSGVVRNGNTCSGTCHGKSHNNEGW